jgi:hypothetical protein
MTTPPNDIASLAHGDPNSSAPQHTSILGHGLERAATVATVVSFIAQSFGLGLRPTAIIFLLTLGGYLLTTRMVAAAKLQLSARLPVWVASILFATLVGALLRQHIMDARIADLGEVTDTFHWQVWFCFEREQCIANVLANLREKIPGRSWDASAQLFSDQALGAVIRTSAVSVQLLHKLYGIDERFLGTGSSLPSGKKEFVAQRIPEFLVPNFNDDHPGVLAWRISNGSDLLSKPLQELLQSPTVNSQVSPNDIRKEIRENLKNSDRPSLVRFAMVPDTEEHQQGYSGCFGLPARHRVFFSSLDYMQGNTFSLYDAADLSGYRFDPQASNQHLYVFMFVPDSASEVVVPTWFNLAADVKEEVQVPPKCQPSKR